MRSLLSPHWCPAHAGGEDDKFMRDLNPPFIKIFTQGEDVPRLDVAVSAAREKVIVRQHQISENYGERFILSEAAAIAEAKKHAAHMQTILNKYPPSWRSKITVEGLNEPQIWPWASESIPLVIKYYDEYAKRMADYGCTTVFMNLGVGWPGNDEPIKPPNSPPNWWSYAKLEDAIKRSKGYLGLHEYWYVNGPKDPYIKIDKIMGGWGWWAGRFKVCPFDVPILITECGIDSHVVGDPGYFGFHGLNPANGDIFEQYMLQLFYYEGQCLADGRVKGITPFLYDFYNNEWATFDMRNDQCRGIWLDHSKKELIIPQEWPLPKWSSEPWKPSVSPGVPAPTPVPIPIPTNVWGDKQIDRWKDLCYKYSYNIDPRVIGTIIRIESAGIPTAISSAGAVGLMQVMPKSTNFPNRPTKEELLNPDFNVKYGCAILLANMKHYTNSSKQLSRALAAYYGGWSKGDDLDNKDSVFYLNSFSKTWKALWLSDSPAFGGETNLVKKLNEAIDILEEAKKE